MSFHNDTGFQGGIGTGTGSLHGYHLREMLE